MKRRDVETDTKTGVKREGYGSQRQGIRSIPIWSEVVQRHFVDSPRSGMTSAVLHLP
jgi:hypothetical protein